MIIRLTILFLMLVIPSYPLLSEQNITTEKDTNRPGGKYKSFKMKMAKPENCSKACANDAQCKAYTYVKPGKQGDKAVCYLKNVISEKVVDSCCVSGAKIVDTSNNMSEWTTKKLPEGAIEPPVNYPVVKRGELPYASGMVGSCRDQIAYYINWLNGGSGRSVAYMLTTVKKKNVPPVQQNSFAYTSISQAPLHVGCRGQCLTDVNRAKFTDRGMCSREDEEEQHLYVYDSGEAAIVNRERGNRKLQVLDIKCPKQGFITGHIEEPDGFTQVVIALQQY